MIIIGAGLSGLLCGALNPGSIIYEAGPERDSDHKAVLRCKSNEISRLTGIHFQEVTVHKAIWYNDKEVQPTPRFAHMYSKKVTGKISARSIFNIESGVRYIPPANFVEQLKKRCNIEYELEIRNLKGFSDTIISTIPMPALAKIINEPYSGKFGSRQVIVNHFEIEDCDSHVTIYYPDPALSVYRATLNGSTLIIESSRVIDSIDMGAVVESMGLDGLYPEWQTVTHHVQKFGKISEIDKQSRKYFILQATLKHGIYSLGRFATWRPKVMLDDVLDDIFVIRRLIQGGNYSTINHEQGDR